MFSTFVNAQLNCPRTRAIFDKLRFLVPKNCPKIRKLDELLDVLMIRPGNLFKGMDHNLPENCRSIFGTTG